MAFRPTVSFAVAVVPQQRGGGYPGSGYEMSRSGAPVSDASTINQASAVGMAPRRGAQSSMSSSLALVSSSQGRPFSVR